MKKLQFIVEDQKDEIEWLLVRIDSSSEENHLVRSCTKTVTTASQTNVNMTEHTTNNNSYQPAEAADKISRLEE